MNSNEKVLYALLGGLGAGILLGILFAPEKGSVLRHKIIGKANDLGNQLKSTATGAMDKINEVGNSARSTFEKVKQETNNQ